MLITATHLAEAGTAVTVGGDWGFAVQLIQFGFVGLVLLLIVTGKYIVPQWTSDRALKALQDTLDDAKKDIDERMDQQKAYYEARLVDNRTASVDAVTNRDATIVELKAANERYARLIEERVVPTLVQANQLAANYAEDMRRRSDGHGPS